MALLIAVGNWLAAAAGPAAAAAALDDTIGARAVGAVLSALGGVTAYAVLVFCGGIMLSPLVS